jgi:hypothetical protein
MCAHAMSCGMRSFSKSLSVPWGDASNILLCQTPASFDGVEVWGIRRKELDTCAACLDEGRDARVLVSLRIVHNHDVARAQLGCEPTTHPCRETLTVCGFEHRAERDPSRDAYRTDHRQVCSPVHRAPFGLLGAARNPRVRAPHREIGPGFIEKYETFGRDTLQPPSEARALGLDIRSRLLEGTKAFFLKTYPARRSAR